MMRFMNNKPRNALKRAIKIMGTQLLLAQGCGVTQSRISLWLRSGIIPPAHVLKIERLTKGKVKCWELRPDLYPRSCFDK